MKKSLLIYVFILAGSLAYGQQYPHFNQFYLNPYSYNPASIGSSDQYELNINYHKQWAGVVDAPVTTSFNYQHPLPGNISFGIHFYNDKSILLSSSNLTLGASYKVKFDKSQSLRFGLSAGLGFNNFDLAEAIQSGNGGDLDPALTSAVEKTNHISGQFGIYYQYDQLKLGFSLPQLFKQYSTDTENFQEVVFDKFDNFALTASYKFNFGVSEFGLEPFAMYRKSELSYSFLEMGAVVDYRDKLWAGGSYRTKYGMTFHLGMNIKENVALAYSYELATAQTNGLGNGSHEFGLRFRFGQRQEKAKKEKKLITRTPELYAPPIQEKKAAPAPVKKETPVVVDSEPVKVVKSKSDEELMAEDDLNGLQEYTEYEFDEDTDLVDEEGNKIDKVTATRKFVVPGSVTKQDADLVTFEKIDDFYREENVRYKSTDSDVNPGYYMILGTFKNHKDALDFSRIMDDNGIEVKCGFVNDKNQYYVYTVNTEDNYQNAKKILEEKVNNSTYKEAWILE